MFYHNMETYDGHWRNGMKHGKGIWNGQNGQKVTGYWNDGQFVGEKGK